MCATIYTVLCVEPMATQAMLGMYSTSLAIATATSHVIPRAISLSKALDKIHWRNKLYNSKTCLGPNSRPCSKKRKDLIVHTACV